jgi:hypothetical protein
MSLKNPVTPPGIDPGTVRLVAQRLNHYATPGLTRNYARTIYFSFVFWISRYLHEDEMLLKVPAHVGYRHRIERRQIKKSIKSRFRQKIMCFASNDTSGVGIARSVSRIGYGLEVAECISWQGPQTLLQERPERLWSQYSFAFHVQRCLLPRCKAVGTWG